MNPLLDALLQRYGARVSEARQFALQYRVVLLEAENGIPLDVALGAMPFEERSIETILIRQKDKLDPQIIWDELLPLVELKEEPEIVSRLQQLMTT